MSKLTKNAPINKLAPTQTKDMRNNRLRSGRNISLILFSGGIDSTHLLWDKLANTDDLILAHHVHLINSEGRHKSEQQACAKIVSHLRQNHRDFFYTECTVDRRRFKAAGTDVITVAFEGGVAASNFLLDTGVMPHHWALGINQEEADEVNQFQVDRLPFILAAMSASCWPNKPPKYCRPKIKPKATLIDEMGSDLSKLCWTCRRPVSKGDGAFSECGTCKTCLLMNEIRN